MKGNLDSENFSFWKLESRKRLESRIQVPWIRNLRPGIQNPTLFWILLLQENCYTAVFSVVTQRSTFVGRSVAWRHWKRLCSRLYQRRILTSKVKPKQIVESHSRATLATYASQISHWFVVGISFGSSFLLFTMKVTRGNAHRRQGKVSSPGPLVTALIFRANLQIAVCPCFRLSVVRFTVCRIGLLRSIRQQFWNEGKTVNWQN